MRNYSLYCVGVALLASAAAQATTFRFGTDPFAGTNVRNTPGRQVLGGEDFISFFTTPDRFSLESTVFGVAGAVSFVNASAANLPTAGVNVIVLESFDDDNNIGTPFGAGNAANLIAAHITTAGPGFFIYFNQGLDLPRLVYSTDLSSTTSDLRILARMLNLNGQTGRNALTNFTGRNFEITTATPEPSTALAVFPALAACFFLTRGRRNRTLLPTRNAMLTD
jgi:hypothetical protein